MRARLAVRAVTELGDTLAAAADAAAPPDQLRALAVAYRAWAHAHTPAATPPSSGRRRPSDTALAAAAARTVAVVVGELRPRGPGGGRGARHPDRVRATLHGFVALEAAGGFGLPDDVEQTFARLVAGLEATLTGAG